jgi:PAS domain S-box-containing protein
MQRSEDRAIGSYALAVLLCVIAGGLARILDAPSSSFLLAVVAASLFGGRGPAYLAIVCSSVAFELFFLPPSLHLMHSGASFLRWGVFVGVLLVTETLLNAKRQSDLGRLALAEEFRSLAETSPDGIFIADQSWRVRFANPALLKMFGRSLGDVLGTPTGMLLPSFQPNELSGEHVTQRADGSVFHVEATCGQFGDNTTIFLRDISDRKTAEEDRRRIEDSLRRTQARLAKAAQSAAISELAAAVVHEISQPLSAMVANGQACLRWLGTTPPNAADGRAAAERIVRDGKDAAEIVRGLRSLFRKVPSEAAPLDLRSIIEEVLSLMRGRADRENIRIDMIFPAGLPRVQGDKTQLQQVLMNLLSNAMDALTGFAGSRRVTICTRKEDSLLITDVIDNGPHPPDFTTIFDPFVTTKSDGMGMGLAICRSIIRAHDGQLFGAAHPDGGTVFTFTLPCLREPAHDF